MDGKDIQNRKSEERNMRKFFQCAIVTVAKVLHKLSLGKLTPNIITGAGLLLHLPIAWLIIDGQFTNAGIALLLIGALDAIDGSLARIQDQETPFGAWFDATSDRLKETIILSALAYYLAETGAGSVAIALCAAVLGISISISYFKAKGEAILAQRRRLKATELNTILAGGLLSYEWRVLILAATLISQQFFIGLCVMAGFGLITLLQRAVNFQGQLPARKK